jgi:hypothetical protein
MVRAIEFGKYVYVINYVLGNNSYKPTCWATQHHTSKSDVLVVLNRRNNNSQKHWEFNIHFQLHSAKEEVPEGKAKTVEDDPRFPEAFVDYLMDAPPTIHYTSEEEVAKSYAKRNALSYRYYSKFLLLNWSRLTQYKIPYTQIQYFRNQLCHSMTNTILTNNNILSRPATMSIIIINHSTQHQGTSAPPTA